MKNSACLLAATISLSGALLMQTPAPHAAAPITVNDAVVQERHLPRKLSDFGFFQNGRAQIPAANVMPYRLNIPLYSDGAEKLRFVYLPDALNASAAGEGLLALPVGAALIKTFAFGEGEDRRLIETRVLLHRADGWVALPYIWSDEQTDARLAIAGARIDMVTPRGEGISYRVPNKNQCKECHGLDGVVIPIGPKARNLSGEWLKKLTGLGKLDAVPQGHSHFPLWKDRATADLTASARGYLDVNCAHCHRPGATASNSGLDLRWEQDDLHALGINKRPVAAGRGSGGHTFDIVPGDPDGSIMTFRMRSNEAGVAMPELGKTTIDQDGADIVARWIEGMQ
ncbi:SO2930 family diheme c-type cytochrome [Pontixanthobacter sp.]|uniref:SO2930 family diheme c-type cytochrome n=1 Tax=Pontixanthobacter sp. TaxID=2792078 RepID=UPI003C7E719C